MSGKESLSSSNDKDGKKSDEKVKPVIGNRLFKPTAASVAKSRQASTTVKGGMKPGLTAGPLRRSIKRPTGPATTQKSKLQTSKKSNDSDASKKNSSKESPKESEKSTDDKSGHEVEIPDASEEGHVDTSGGSSRQSRPDKPGSGEKRDQTPDTSVMPTNRGVSTPTGEDCGSQTILDSWDASQIVGVNKTQVAGLNETLVEPVLSLKESFAMPKPVLGKFTTRKTLPVPKSRKSSLPGTIAKGANASVMDFNNTIMESEDSDFDKLLDQAYQRYIQSLYLKHVCSQAENKITKECNEKLVGSWRLLEEDRQHVLRKKEQLEEAKLVSDLQAVLHALEPYLKTNSSDNKDSSNLTNQIEQTRNKLKTLSQSLEHIKHNIEIKGIAIDRENGYTVAQDLMNRIENFTKRIKSGVLFSSAMEEGIQLLKGFKEEVQCIESNRKTCDEMVEKCRRLATKEVSLNISLSMAKEAVNNNPPKDSKVDDIPKINVDLLESEASRVDDDVDHGAGDVTLNLVKSFDGLAHDGIKLETPPSACE